MGQGSVTVNNINQVQGELPGIERKALFIGLGTKNAGQVLSVNAQTDFEDALGVNGSEIKDNVLAALANGGENWQGYAAPQNADYDWEAVVDQAMVTVSPELMVLCRPVTSSAEVEAMQVKAESLRTTLARRVIILTATAGIADQSWSEYETAQSAITEDVAAYRVACVPQLHGNDLGAVVGRLCNRAVSIADSPMRVATGPVLGLGDTPIDKDGVPLPSATVSTLDANRLSCSQTYPDYPGTYWGDVNLLDIPGGDYQVIEHLRPVDKVARGALAGHCPCGESLTQQYADQHCGQ